ncbi:MAG: alpha/beta hydrolase [Burkholderiaceae bacterium]|nr:alpha/beta hydrolase [Burkholderiaceae bacterium]
MSLPGRARGENRRAQPEGTPVRTEVPIPETRCAESDGLSIAYQVFGSGARDLVLFPGIVSHLEANGQWPDYARLMAELVRRFCVIVFDKRGQGLSDRFEGVPMLEQRMDDLRAVMQAADSQRALLFATSEGGALGALFTASHPAMVERLVTLCSSACSSSSVGSPASTKPCRPSASRRYTPSSTRPCR